MGVEVADVAGGDQAVEHRLAVAARVAVHDHLVGDEDAAVTAGLVDLAVLLVEQPHPGAVRRRARGAGRGAQLLGRGDRRPRDLGRAVEVVEDVAEGVHHAQREVARQRRAADRDHAQRARVVARDHLGPQLEDPRQHHRHDDQRGRAVAVDRGERQLRVEAAPQHERRGQRQPERVVGVSPRVKERRGDQRRPRARAAGSARTAPPPGRGCAAGGARRPSARRSCRRSGSRRGRGRAAARGAPRSTRRSARRASAAPGAAESCQPISAGPPLGGRGAQLAELLVVDQDARVLARTDLGDLAAGEGGVQQHAASRRASRPRPRTGRSRGGRGRRSRSRRPRARRARAGRSRARWSSGRARRR